MHKCIEMRQLLSDILKKGGLDVGLINRICRVLHENGEADAFVFGEAEKKPRHIGKAA